MSHVPETPLPGPDARLFSVEMTHVEGRRGIGWSVIALARHVARRILGLRRPFRYKVLPGIFTLIAYLPSIVFLGFAALLPEGLADEVLPTPAEAYGFITFALILFTALAGPQSLCPDRRDRVLGLYLASPLDRTTYLLANAIGVVGVFFLLTIGPPLLLAVGLSLLGSPTASLFVLLYRVLAGGLLLAVAFAAVGLAAAAVTDRRAFAAAIVVVGLLGTGIAGGVLEELGVPDQFAVVSFVALVMEAASRVHGQSLELSELAWPVVYGGYAAWIAGLVGIVWLRYRRLKVVR